MLISQIISAYNVIGRNHNVRIDQIWQAGSNSYLPIYLYIPLIVLNLKIGVVK